MGLSVATSWGWSWKLGLTVALNLLFGGNTKNGNCENGNLDNLKFGKMEIEKIQALAELCQASPSLSKLSISFGWLLHQLRLQLEAGGLVNLQLRIGRDYKMKNEAWLSKLGISWAFQELPTSWELVTYFARYLIVDCGFRTSPMIIVPMDIWQNLDLFKKKHFSKTGQS